MITSTPSEELDRLLSRMTEARLGPKESQKLAGLIEADPELRFSQLKIGITTVTNVFPI